MCRREGALTISLDAPQAQRAHIELNAGEWFDDWSRGGVVQEDAQHFSRFNQTLALLWFEDDRVPTSSSGYGDDDDEAALRPLDGYLPWQGKSRRRR